MFVLNTKKDCVAANASEEVWSELQDPDVRDKPDGILAVLCDWIEQQQCHEFVIVTPEKTYRPLVSRDLLIFLEQLPDVNAAVNNSHVSEFFVDFFEQGFELKIVCRKENGSVLARCIEDYWNTAKEVGVVKVRQQEFTTTIRQVAQTFAEVVLAFYPHLRQMTAFIDWCRQSGCHLL